MLDTQLYVNEYMAAKASKNAGIITGEPLNNLFTCYFNELYSRFSVSRFARQTEAALPSLYLAALQ